MNAGCSAAAVAPLATVVSTTRHLRADGRRSPVVSPPPSTWVRAPRAHRTAASPADRADPANEYFRVRGAAVSPDRPTTARSVIAGESAPVGQREILTGRFVSMAVVPQGARWLVPVPEAGR